MKKELAADKQVKDEKGFKDFYLKSKFGIVKDENDVEVQPTELDGKQYVHLRKGFFVKEGGYNWKVVDIKFNQAIIGNKFKVHHENP